MTDSSNIIEMAAAEAPKKVRGPRGNRPFERQIRDQLYSHEDAVREAKAIADLLHEKFIETTLRRISLEDMETLMRGLGGIRRLLGDVRGLGDPDELVQQIEDRRARLST